MAAKLTDQEKQAVGSVILAAVAAVIFVCQTGLILMNFNFQDFEAAYSSKGMRLPIILGATALAGALGALGSYLGFTSAGHNRNKKQAWSWAGFFLNSAVITLTLSMFVLFWLAKEDVGAR